MSFLWSKGEAFINTDIPGRNAIDNLGISRMDVWRAVGREALLDNPEQLLANIVSIKYQEKFNQNKLSQEEFEERYSRAGLEYDPNMTEELAEYLLARKKQRDINEYIIAHGKGGFMEAAGAFQASALRQKLLRREYDLAADEFLKWVYARGLKLKGLIKRRLIERNLFLSGS